MVVIYPYENHLHQFYVEISSSKRNQTHMISEWCFHNFGLSAHEVSDEGNWYVIFDDSFTDHPKTKFWFKKYDDAVLFELTWGGV